MAEEETILSKDSDPFGEGGKIDAYSDEFADDLLNKLDKQTMGVRGVETTLDLEEKKEIVKSSTVPELPPVIHT